MPCNLRLEIIALLREGVCYNLPTVLSSFLRMQLLNPLRVRGLLAYLPQFVRVFWRLMHDRRVSFLAKLTPLIGVMLLITPPALELDLVPIIGELDWILVDLPVA